MALLRLEHETDSLTNLIQGKCNSDRSCYMLPVELSKFDYRKLVSIMVRFSHLMYLLGIILIVVSIMIFDAAFSMTELAEFDDEIYNLVMFYESFGLVLLIGGMVIIPFGNLWSKRQTQTRVISIAKSHERITVDDISKKSDLPSQVVSKALYKAIGKGKLKGTMEENTFVRAEVPSQKVPSPVVTSESKPPTEPATQTIREKEIITKVLVVCPFCGAKTEQGLSKCQNCKADL